MTPRELELLDLVRDRIAAGVAPTYAEISSAMGISVSAVSSLIGSLIADGKLAKVPGKARSLNLRGVADLRSVPTASLQAELARRGVALDALDGGERVQFGRRRSRGAGSGTCAAPGCQLQVQRGHLMCLSHWRALPFALRKRILSTHMAARASRCPEDAARYGEAVAEAREMLDRRGEFC
ncbi:hypothetical protein [Sphingomonas sp.]|uniref:LexA family protein n=1 Tax=Sphingomonas sp. TaxID=28214 RepID=UPI00307E73F5